MIAALMAWGDKWSAPDGPPLVMRHTCDGRGAPQTVCTACGEPMDLAHVRAKAGPGLRPTSLPAD